MHIPASVERGAPFHIAFGVDAPYFRYMAVTMTSVLEHNPGMAFVFHVLTFSATGEQRCKLQMLEAKYGVSIRIHIIDLAVFRNCSAFSNCSQYSKAIFTRLLIPETLRGITSEVLYLDADILCTGGIAELRAMDMSERVVAAVSDHAGTTVKRQVAALNLRHGRYFNSGVLYIQVDNWNANGITGQVMNIILNGDKKLEFPDQDALNIVFDGRVVFIDEKWNFRYNLEVLLKNGVTRMGPEGEGVFLHFTGRVKPWHDWSPHESKALFLKYQSLSPWSGTPLDAPRNYKEMRMCSRFLFKRGRFVDSIAWYFRYLSEKLFPRYKAG